jgi:hypothetical protein
MKYRMNKFFILFFAITTLIGCKKNEDILFNEALVEIDWASFNTRTSGYPFTLFTRVPTEPGRGVYNSANTYGFTDPSLTRLWPTTDTIRMRINLVGKQMPTAQSFEMNVANTFTTAIEGSATTPGAHFQLIDRIVTIPTNSSFGFCRWVVRNPGITNNLPVTVVFQLKGNSEVKVSENYQYIGWSITQ